ncbi:hypothetical protein [Paenibacillus woosongensis]|uniref:hypothetical protein n=1 Tax=Paenibacillus woosongensis TaxID=307580 RepID=UPI0018C295EF|nr:hypothetical protein [Paenibacillus woosongensis]
MRTIISIIGELWEEYILYACSISLVNVHMMMSGVRTACGSSTKGERESFL